MDRITSFLLNAMDIICENIFIHNINKALISLTFNKTERYSRSEFNSTKTFVEN